MLAVRATNPNIQRSPLQELSKEVWNNVLELKVINRTQYRPSGKVAWARFVLGSLLLVVLACLNGVLLTVLYVIATKFVPLGNLLLPVVAGYWMCWLVYRILIWSHCRNVGIASLLGLMCGIVLSISEYQTLRVAVACQSGGTLETEIARLDKLPDYILRRIQEDRNNPNNTATTNAILWRTALALLEFSIIAGLPILLARRAAGRAYSETEKRYFEQLIVRATWGSGDRIVKTLEARQSLTETLSTIRLCDHDPRPKEVAFLSFKQRKKGDIECSWMVLEYLQNDDGEWESACLTDTEISPSGKRQPLFRQLNLESAELPAARKLFVG